MVGHDEFIELLGAYALDAVDHDERRALEAHLAVCPSCQAEVMEHMEVAAALSTQYPATMPDGLWDRIATQIDNGPTSAGGEPLHLPRLTMFDPVDPAGTTMDAIDDEPAVNAPDTVVSLDEARRSRRPGRIATGLVAAAAAIVIALLGAGLVRANDENTKAREVADSIARRPAIEVAAQRALEDPANKRYVLTSETSGAKATAVLTANGDGYLLPEGMPNLPPDRAYQLWEIGTAGPVSLGVMGNEPRATAFHVHGAVPMLAITNEVAGGVPAPQTKPLMTATA